MMSVNPSITINLPGSKSYTNRALIAAALAKGKSRLFGYGECEDTEYMISALKTIGLKINDKCQNKCIEIEGGVDKLKVPLDEINIGNAGTTMRFLVTLVGLMAARSSRQSEIVLTGSERMCERPIGDLLDALESLGINVESERGDGNPPLKIPMSKSQRQIKSQNPNVKLFKTGGKTKLRGDASSQYLTSILLSAPYFGEDTEIEISGELTSKPYVDMTIEVMNDFGVKVINQNYKKFIVKAGQEYQPRDYKIEPDASGASYFIVGAALTNQKVVFPGLSLKSKQGDARFINLIKKMQPEGQIAETPQGLSYQGKGELQGIEIDMNKMTDTAQTLAVLAMFARGKTVIKNVKNLRIKETDRLHALASEIQKFGVDVEEKEDGLEIINNKLEISNKFKIQNSKFQINTYNDHRMAMSFAVAKLAFPDIMIENPDCVFKSFPGFWEEWGKIS